MLGWISTSSEKPRSNQLTFFLVRIPARVHLSSHHKTKMFETERVPPYFSLCISLFIFLAPPYSLWIVSGSAPYYMVDFINSLEILQCHQIFLITTFSPYVWILSVVSLRRFGNTATNPFWHVVFPGFYQGVDAHMSLFFFFSNCKRARNERGNR